MNTRLRKSFGFYTGLVYDSKFMVNHYNLEISMLTVSSDNFEQNIAYDRIKHWMYSILDDSILIAADNPLLEHYQKTNARLLILPQEPVDQIIGIMLYLKLNAVMENRMVVTDTEIWSTQGDNMSYVHSHGEALGQHLNQNGWWVDARPTWHDGAPPSPADKIVNLDRVPEWKDIGLGWENTKEQSNQTVVFANFTRDADK